MYRLLKKENLNVHRGRAKAPKNSLKIETKAIKPNEVWCWDITYLPTSIRGKHLKLYLFEDLYSRKIIGSHIDELEDEKIALNLLQSCLKKEKITGLGLRIHSGIGYITPDPRHQGLDLEVFKGRNEVLRRAKIKNPSRWNLKLKQWKRIEIVELNEVGCRVV